MRAAIITLLLGTWGCLTYGLAASNRGDLWGLWTIVTAFWALGIYSIIRMAIKDVEARKAWEQYLREYANQQAEK
ncbi:MAG: hypothetical protein K6T68_08700 [Alicyclobacillus shizuokensis]|nr:hypothetical protein [Alicyclobacillus shizuokensis]